VGKGGFVSMTVPKIGTAMFKGNHDRELPSLLLVVSSKTKPAKIWVCEEA
jgi:hypothetical protein